MIIDYNGLKTMALLVGVAAMAVIISIMLNLASGLRKAKLLGEARTMWRTLRIMTSRQDIQRNLILWQVNKQ